MFSELHKAISKSKTALILALVFSFSMRASADGTNLASAYKSSVWISPEGILYSWGIDQEEGLSKTFQVIRGPWGSEKIIFATASWYDTILVVSETGSLWKNEHGDWNNKKIELSNVQQACAGSMYEVALTQDGKIFSFGDNYHGQLGRSPHSRYDAIYPGLVEGPWGNRKIKQVSCGTYETLAVTEDGQLYGWGNNYGKFPKLIEGPWNNISVKKVESGGPSNLILTDDGKLFALGNVNVVPMMALGGNVNVPTVVEGPWKTAKVAAMSVKDGVSFILTEGQKLYAWGYIDDREFLDQDSLRFVNSPLWSNWGIEVCGFKGYPILIQGVWGTEKIQSISANVGRQTLLVATENGEVYAWKKGTSFRMYPEFK